VYHFFFSVTNLEENFLRTVKENAIAWEEQSAGKIYCQMINVRIYTTRRKDLFSWFENECQGMVFNIDW